jgi:ankyrin repeat protein
MGKESGLVHVPRTTLENLPLELLWLISDHLSYASIGSLARCNSRLNFLLNSILYHQDMLYGGFHALKWAASERCTSTARRVFEYRADVPLPHTLLQIAMYRAMKNCSWGIIRLLVVNGADANTSGKGFGCALQAASWKGDVGLVQLLIDAGAKLNAQNGHFGTALAAAAWCGHFPVVALLVGAGADINAHGGHYGNALQAASWAGRRSIVEYLVKNGASLHSVGGFYGSSLQAACWVGNEEIVKTLLKAGHGTASQGHVISSALKVAYNRGNMSIFRTILTWTLVNAIEWVTSRLR